MLIVLVFVYSKYISNYISKHISKDNDNKTARRFCAVLVALLYTYIAILRQPCRVPDFSILRRCWSCCGAGGVVSLYLTRYGQSAPRIAGRVAAGGVSACVGVSFVAGGAAYPPHPTPKTRPRNLGCLSKNFFLKFYFFNFAFVIEVFVSQ